MMDIFESRLSERGIQWALHENNKDDLEWCKALQDKTDFIMKKYRNDLNDIYLHIVSNRKHHMDRRDKDEYKYEISKINQLDIEKSFRYVTWMLEYDIRDSKVWPIPDKTIIELLFKHCVMSLRRQLSGMFGVDVKNNIRHPFAFKLWLKYNSYDFEAERAKK
jgi:hypothetical protein